MKRATIDIGTNTTLLLVAEGTTPSDVCEIAGRAEITRLGRGIGKDGRLGAEGVAKTLDVLRGYAAIAREQGAAIAAIGTEALRRAPNAREFLDPAAEILGVPVEVIDGEREAALTFLAARLSFPRAAAAPALIVIDIGGGSTEIIVAERGAIRFRQSAPLGSVRLTERHVRTDPATNEEVDAIRADVRMTLEALALPALPARPLLIGTAGTVTTLAAMVQQLVSYDPALVHGYELGAAALDAEIERLRRATQAEREGMAGLDPRRADVILAGACILQEIARRFDADPILVNDRGIRWGLLFEGMLEGR